MQTYTRHHIPSLPLTCTPAVSHIQFEFDFVIEMYFAQFWITVGFALVALAASIIYERFEARRPSAANLGSRQDSRSDDSLFMRIAWTVAWASATVMFLPVFRTLLGAADCTSRQDRGYSWDRDTTTPLNDVALMSTLNETEQAKLHIGEYVLAWWLGGAR